MAGETRTGPEASRRLHSTFLALPEWSWGLRDSSILDDQSATLTADRTPQWMSVGTTSLATRPADSSQVRYSFAE
jgi:hypothetical protein